MGAEYFGVSSFLILHMCNSAVCDMELQFPRGSLPKELIKASKSK